jgi:hypothetical protein
VVSVVSTKVIDVQGDLGVIHKPLKKFDHQIHVELADFGTREGHVKLQARTTATVDHDARKRLVEGDVGVTIAHDASQQGVSPSTKGVL